MGTGETTVLVKPRGSPTEGETGGRRCSESGPVGRIVDLRSGFASLMTSGLIEFAFMFDATSRLDLSREIEAIVMYRDLLEIRERDM